MSYAFECAQARTYAAFVAESQHAVITAWQPRATTTSTNSNERRHPHPQAALKALPDGGRNHEDIRRASDAPTIVPQDWFWLSVSATIMGHTVLNSAKEVRCAVVAALHLKDTWMLAL